MLDTLTFNQLIEFTMLMSIVVILYIGVLLIKRVKYANLSKRRNKLR